MARQRNPHDQGLGEAAYSARACGGKIQYPSKGHARGTIRVMQQQGKHAKAGAVLMAYRCRHCRKWHVGNSTPRHGASWLELALAAVLKPFLEGLEQF